MPLASCPAAYQSSVRRGARPPTRRLDCTAPGRSTSSSGTRGRSGTRGTSAPLPSARQPSRAFADLVEDARRRQVADQHQQAAAGYDASPVERLQRARRHLGDLVGRRQRAAVGMVAVTAVQPGLVGDHARLGQGPAQVVAEPAGLALGGRARERRVGEHLGEQAEQVAQPGAQRLAGEGHPVGAVVDPQAAADALERLGELALGPAAGAEHDRARQHARSSPGRRRGGWRWAPAGAGGPAARWPGVRRPRSARWEAPARRSRAAAACGAWSARGRAGACARDGSSGLMRHHRRPGRGGHGRRVSGPRQRRPPGRR